MQFEVIANDGPCRPVATKALIICHFNPPLWPPFPAAEMTSEPTYTITELAREFAVTHRAIRYYEDQGLLSPDRVGSARVYSKRDRTRLKLMLRGKRLGLSLAEIRELIALYTPAQGLTPQTERFLAALAQRKAALEQQREDIDAVLAEITSYERQCHDLLGAESAERSNTETP